MAARVPRLTFFEHMATKLGKQLKQTVKLTKCPKRQYFLYCDISYFVNPT